MNTKHYDSDFYAALRHGTMRSAKVVAPILIELFHPRSVIDVGCGEGLWLSAFQELGIYDVLGIDGDYVPVDHLAISRRNFLPCDLREPIHVERSFDLAISLEVAEHLPGSSAMTFVSSLTKLAPIILFSAAIPLQGGTNHLNEQWPDYWAERFSSLYYQPIDCMRSKIWSSPEVDWWYKQNMILYVNEVALKDNPGLAALKEACANWPLSIVHPDAYLEASDAERHGVPPFSPGC